MNGLGNDFVVVDVRAYPAWGDLLASPAVVRRLCDRHRGIGADGVLAILAAQSVGSVATMRVHNADGSLAEMCGNGLRCVAWFLAEQPPNRSPQTESSILLQVDTGAGPLRCLLSVFEDGRACSVEIEMGRPHFATQERITLSLGPQAIPLELSLVSMGNPHAVTFCDEARSYDELLSLAQRLGPWVEVHSQFPQRTNVEFVRRNPQHALALDVVVWERGCGVTQACGTGACAAVVVAGVAGVVPLGQRCAVRLPGGVLDIVVAQDLSVVSMRGPAETVFCGEVETSTIMALDGPAE